MRVVVHRKVVVTGIILAGVLATGGWMWKQKNPVLVRIVHISFLAPRVEVAGAQGEPAGWSQALPSAPVIEGEHLRTLAQGELEVQLECGSALRLAPNSEFSFPQLSLLPDGVTTTEVAVQSGSAFFSLRHMDSRDFEVLLSAPVEAAIVPQGSATFRVDVAPAAEPNASAAVQVTAGHADVHVGSAVYKLKKSMRLVWSPVAAPQVQKPAPPDAWARWSRSRDDQFSRSLLASLPVDQFAGAAVAAPPGSTPVTKGTPQSNWNDDGFLESPSGFFVNQDHKWATISDQASSPIRDHMPIPACARY